MGRMAGKVVVVTGAARGAEITVDGGMTAHVSHKRIADAITLPG